MKLPDELSLLHGEEESHETFLQMLHHLSGLMSNRCSTMKSFDRALQEERKLMLQTDEDIQFLHCNSRFLLSLSVQCEKILAKREKESGERLRRDLLAQFRSYQSKSESSASQSADEETGADAKRKVIVDEQRQKRLGEAEKKRLAIVTVMDKLQSHRGPRHLYTLLASYGSRTNQKTAVQAELKFHKHILGLKCPLLKITGSLL
ncbi:hypothetical protein LSH36_20g15003 [Paralvinella palmiformis]|uniref:Uncharacterized protein n=1 Tax=Paralvinella palmiformis TaxID=53620 RepID=A0AAD9NGW8_9ANNE|nr:hypothetical protein LSH36_20g15003 [Paralvinella palmiformis]